MKIKKGEDKLVEIEKAKLEKFQEARMRALEKEKEIERTRMTNKAMEEARKGEILKKIQEHEEKIKESEDQKRKELFFRKL